MQVKKFSELKARFMKIKRRQIAATVMVTLTALLVVLAVFEFFRLIKVTNIVVKGESPYTNEEIIAFSGVEKGEYSYFFDKDDIETKLLDSAPYLREVKVYRIFTRLVIKVKADTAKYYLQISDKTNDYYILSADLRVLECESNIASIKEKKLIYLELPHLAICSVGRFIEYDEPEKCGYVKENLDYFSTDEYKDTITAIGLSSRFDNCYVDFYGKCRVIFGKPENMEMKIKKATDILGNFSEDENIRYLIIDVSDPDKAIYSMPESLD